MNALSSRAFTPLSRRMTVAACVLVLTAMIVADRQAVLLGSFTPRSSLVDSAAALDLTVGLTFVAWWVLGRELGWRAVALVPLFFASLVVAAVALPPGHRGGLRLAHLAAAPLELVTMVFLVRKVLVGRRAFRREGRASETDAGPVGGVPWDAQEALQRAAAEALGPGRFADAIAYEMSVLYFGLFARDRGPVPEGALTYHRKTAWGAVVFALLMATTVEVVAVHLLVSLWSHRLAWILTGLGVYGGLWLYGDWRACRLRPAWVEDGVLHIRFGLRWRVDLPLDGVTCVRSPTPEERATKRGVDLRLGLPGAAWRVLELDRPVQAEGIYGLRRSVRTLGLGLDEPERLTSLFAPAGELNSNQQRT